MLHRRRWHDTIEPLPSTGISKILGMCEILDDKGGREDLFALARDLHMPFSEVLLVIKAAEMLALIDTPGPRGAAHRVRQEAPRRAHPREEGAARRADAQAQRLPARREALEVAERGELPAELILEELALRLPHEQPRQMFTTLLNWGRYGDIFGYSRDTDLFFLHRAEKPAT